MPDYAHLACHSYSKTLRWSYGTNRNRQWDAWQQHVAAMAPAHMVRALALADFAGVYVDRRGYPDRGELLLSDLRKLLGQEIAVSASGDQLLFSMSETAARLRSATPEVAWALEKARLMDRPCVLCQDGFFRWSPTTPPEPWQATHTAHLRFINPGDRTRQVTLTMNWQRQGPRDRDVRVTGDSLGIDRPFVVTEDRRPFALEVSLPPGEHVLRCDTSPKPFGPARMHAAWNATDIRLVERD
jgi:hypothetical protein